MDKLINKVGKDVDKAKQSLEKAGKDEKVLLKADKKQDAKIAKCDGKHRR